MAFFKVSDVQVRYTAAQLVNIYVDGIGVGDSPGGRPGTSVNATRAALMLAVFNLGRDCYWDRNSETFVTSTEAITVNPVITSGTVSGWELSMTLSGSIDFFVTLIGAQGPQTSGNAAIAWAKLTVPEDRACLVLSLLSSRYRHYLNGELRNSDAPNFSPPMPVPFSTT